LRYPISLTLEHFDDENDDQFWMEYDIRKTWMRGEEPFYWGA
jgi:hypothetical protein